MYEVKWMPKTEADLEELCNKAVEHGFELVACNDKFCVFKSTHCMCKPNVPHYINGICADCRLPKKEG